MAEFDLIVIGAGSGNSIIDDRFDGWSVALIDNGARFGGTCLNYGCIPTKMFVVPANDLRIGVPAARVGVQIAGTSADWAAVRDRIFGRIDPISDAGQAWREQSPNVTLYRDTARFVGQRRLEVAGEEITAPQVVVAAGSRAALPPIEGLAEAFAAGLAHTSDTIMRIPAVPRRVVILGSGVIAAEFAHVLGGFGAQVTIIARSGALLRQEDAEISRRFTEQASRLADVWMRQRTERIDLEADGSLTVRTVGEDGGRHALAADLLLVATGRIPNGDRLDVAAGGLATDERGFIVVDAEQRTNVAGVWALGDVSSPWMLKHVANAEARAVQHNLLHPEAPVASLQTAVPRAVFSSPQVAAVGLTEREARAAGYDVAVAVQEYGSTAYGWALADTTSCVKLVADRATRKLLGGHIIGPDASVLIQPIITAMAAGLDVATMARGQYWIHPALTEVVENALLSLGLGQG